MSRRRPRLLAVLSALVTAVLLSASALVAPAGAASIGHSRLVVHGNFPDPGFAHFGKYYYLYATGTGFPVRRATSPTGPYRSIGNTMAHVPSWVGTSSTGRHLWAPDVHAVRYSNGTTHYVMYFTGYRKGWGSNCVGVAVSGYPDHGFAAYGSPICALHSDHEAIDPSAYRQANGSRWIVFKTNIGNRSDFRIQAVQMESAYGGIRPVAGTRRTLVSSPTAKMEAPTLISHGGRVWLFLARGDYSVHSSDPAKCSYSTDVWSAATLTSPFARVRTVLSSASTGLCGPGGATVIQDGSTTRIAFHSWASKKVGTKTTWFREAWVGQLRWTKAGPHLY